MTKIIFNSEPPCIAVWGHAGKAAAGCDIVCAGVSALCFTLAEMLTATKGRKERFRPEIYQDREQALLFIASRPESDSRADCLLIYETVCTGLEMLAEKYPDNVSFCRGIEKENESILK